MLLALRRSLCSDARRVRLWVTAAAALALAGPAAAFAQTIGSPGADRLTVKDARGGQIAGGGGADRLTGGPGPDRLLGESGHDFLDGRGGNDRLEGHTGNDRMIGGAGNDTGVGSFGG